MPKEILFDSEAADKMLSGINQLARAVKSTMGPHGKNVIISRDNRVAVTKDGASVAIEVELADPIENVAAQLVKQIAHKTAIETGDGTTTATVLAEALYSRGLKAMKDHNAREVLEGMNLALADIVHELNALTLEVKSTETLREIATISANGDTEIGNWIAEAFNEVGFNGLVTAQLSTGSESKFEITQGMQFNSGYISPLFLINEVPEIVYEKPLIFLFDGKVNAIKEIMPILEYSSTEKANSPIVIIAAGFDAALLPIIAKMKSSGLIRPIFIQIPGGSQPSFFADIAIAIGGKLVSVRNGVTLESLRDGQTIAKFVGSCERIIVKESQTQILGGAGSEEVVKLYTDELRKAIESDSTSPSQKMILKERISRLERGIAIIHVGGDSEVEQREKFDRVEDAIGATKAAIAEGYIAGGGLTLANIAAVLKNEYEKTETKESITVGKRAVLDAVTEPFITIVLNSGYDPKEVWNKICEKNLQNFGFNARTGEYVNLLTAGIIDPTRVTRRALENAASVATLILNSRCLMVKYSNQSSAPSFNMSI